jgi:hypothetical protein
LVNWAFVPSGVKNDIVLVPGGGEACLPFFTSRIDAEILAKKRLEAGACKN